MKLNLCIVDDEIRITESLAEYFIRQGCSVRTANDPHSALEIIHTQPVDVVITDVVMPGMTGLELLKACKTYDPRIEIILISGHGTMATVIDAMRQGAIDYIPKPFRLRDVQMALERTSRFLQLKASLAVSKRQNSLISRQLESRIERQFIGESPQIRQVLSLTMQAAQDRDLNVLITGENGTGKEIIARIIHFAGERKKFPFYPLNSAAIPENLLESEFFGHCKGAFTGATSTREGCLSLADGGTLFLDEIGDMPQVLQAKLLRVLEDKRFRAVGDTRQQQVDVRLISASNKNLSALVQQGVFRMDLLYRLNTLEIHIPPLRERIQDVKPLSRYFCSYFAQRMNRPVPQLSDAALAHVQRYYFPGNVRELRNMIQRAMILNASNLLQSEDFELRLQSEPVGESGFNLDASERKLVLKALQTAGFNQTNAAALLGISRDALRRRIAKHDIVILHEVE